LSTAVETYTGTVVDIADFDPAKIRITAAYRFKELIKTLPGASWNPKNDTWQAPLSWATCLGLRDMFPDLAIGPKLTAWATNYARTHVQFGMVNRELLEPAEPVAGDEDLFPYQQVDAQFLAHQERAFLFSDMGPGKTASAIRGMRLMARQGKTPWPALVACPNTTKIGWGREFERWWPGIKVTVVKGTAERRRRLLTEPAHVYVINYESLRSHSRIAPYGSQALRRCADCGGEDPTVTLARCQVHAKELNDIDFQLVIADEVHRIKEGSSLTARALKAATGDAPYRFGMTGTPIAHNVMDLWSPLNWLEPKEFPSRTRFQDQLVDVMYNAFGGVIISGLKPDKTDLWQRMFDFRMRRMTKDIVLPFLPPVISERRDVELTPKQAKAYKEISADMIATISDEKMGISYLTAAGGLTQTLRLLQLASSYGAVHLGDPRPDGTVPERFVLDDPSSKIDAFMEDMEDFEGRTTVVFAVSRQLIELLSRKMTDAKIPHGLITGAIDEDERQQHIDDFQSGKTKFILCTIAAGGTGITLTAADTRVFLQRSWSIIEMDQAKDRVHRIGSEKHENILHIDYVAPGTIEEAVIAVLDGKYESMEAILRDRDLFLRATKGLL